MFKFNFNEESVEDNGTKLKEQEWKEATEVFAIAISQKLESVKAVDDTVLFYTSPVEAEKTIVSKDKSDIATAYEQKSDLVPSIYEGGLKLWECCFDLVNFLCHRDQALFKGLKVLELGCGAGLPGLYTLRKGATVHFQDYNEDVLRHMTIPNVAANSGNEASCHTTTPCRFFAGDWGSLRNLLCKRNQPEKYDMILTSETIYNSESYSKLHDVFESCLKSTGAIYLAAKTCYFGVGGGTRLFEEFVDQRSVFSYRTIWSTDTGVRREIIELKFKDCDMKGS